MLTARYIPECHIHILNRKYVLTIRLHVCGGTHPHKCLIVQQLTGIQ